jgi:hypothetical protein
VKTLEYQVVGTAEKVFLECESLLSRFLEILVFLYCHYKEKPHQLRGAGSFGQAGALQILFRFSRPASINKNSK